jgi:hypothetical protein
MYSAAWTPAFSGVTTVEIEGRPGGTRDIVAWSPQVERMTIGSFRCRAAAAWVRESEAGEPLSLRACDVAAVECAQGSAPAFEMNVCEPSGWLEWEAGKPAVRRQGAEL